MPLLFPAPRIYHAFLLLLLRIFWTQVLVREKEHANRSHIVTHISPDACAISYYCCWPQHWCCSPYHPNLPWAAAIVAIVIRPSSRVDPRAIYCSLDKPHQSGGRKGFPWNQVVWFCSHLGYMTVQGCPWPSAGTKCSTPLWMLLASLNIFRTPLHGCTETRKKVTFTQTK